MWLICGICYWYVIIDGTVDARGAGMVGSWCDGVQQLASCGCRLQLPAAAVVHVCGCRLQITAHVTDVSCGCVQLAGCGCRLESTAHLSSPTYVDGCGIVCALNAQRFFTEVSWCDTVIADFGWAVVVAGRFAVGKMCRLLAVSAPDL